MQIEFSEIFDKFPKIPLMEVAAGVGQRRWSMAIGAVDGDRQWVALGGNMDILIFS